MDPTVMYLCDGQDKECKRTSCAFTGAGECKHTLDINHAIHFIRRHGHAGNWWEFDPDELSQRVNKTRYEQTTRAIADSARILSDEVKREAKRAIAFSTIALLLTTCILGFQLGNHR